MNVFHINNAACPKIMRLQYIPDISLIAKILKIMKLTLLLVVLFSLQVSARVYSQQISLSVRGASLPAVLEEVSKQTGYDFLYDDEYIKGAIPVTLNIKNVDVLEVLPKLLAGQPFNYRINKKIITLVPKNSVLKREQAANVQRMDVTGIVTDTTGIPLVGVSVRIVGTNIATTTNGNGRYRVNNVPSASVIFFTLLGYTARQIPVDRNEINVTLRQRLDELDEAMVIAYGTTTRRLTTGSVARVTRTEIERQPVSNPIATLAGRVPGLTVTQASGNPGGAFNIQIRGQNSISQGSQPLVLIDGIPFPNNYIGTNDIVMGNGGQSPFGNINPQDIESIEVLKDADATAIYGSRGANGVILITTKKGKAGATRVEASVYQGVGQITRRLDLLNSPQYLEMRREAFANDSIVPTAVNAPDLMLWDTTRHTDWQDYLIGGTANYTNANIALSGGNEYTQFLASANYNRQTAVSPGDFAENRGTGRFNINHTSRDRHFKIGITTNYSVVNNQLPGNLTNYITLPPNNPPLLDEQQRLVWDENGGTFSNPLAFVLQNSTAVTDNFLTNLNLEYQVYKGLNLRLTGGYNFIGFKESYLAPSTSKDPNSSSTLSSSTFANTTNKNWIVEPQLEYNITIKKGKLNALIGTNLQNDNRDLQVIEASGFPNDELLEATAFAEMVTTRTSKSEYRYQALFGRINYNYDGKYLINLTGRRDGSSRFGANRKVANFGAVGAAWVVSEERWLKNDLKWLSFGKLRGSYGVTGNDQIGDYQYLDNYSATSTQYQGQIGYIPSRLYNADYTWERNKKLEAAVDLGFINNRINLTVNRFRNRSDNQLINYKLPNQTGFSSILRNFEALVENVGWEFLLSATPIQKSNFHWSTSFNLTRSSNRLLEFPGLESSSYANTLVIGMPLSIAKYLHWTGVDPETGIHSFQGTSRPADQTVVIDFTPKYYGGFSNSITYKNWDFSFLFQFVKQKGINYMSYFGGNTPGTRFNQPVEVLERWQDIGNNTSVQRFTTTGAANTAYRNYIAYSDGRVSDASFIRFKNLYLSYTLSNQFSRKIGFNLIKLYYQGQNLFTITDFEGLDPEIGNSSLPSLAVNSLGIQLTL